MSSLAEANPVAGMQDDLGEAYPPGAPLTFWRLTAERQALRFRLKYLESIKAGCRTCEHFGHERGFNRCAVFDETPPAEFIDSDGKCDSWVHDGVAF